MTNPTRPCAVVVGGANLDLKVRSNRILVPATSNPGTARMTPGGVGRNVAENLARLGTCTYLLAAVGDDVAAAAVLQVTQEAGVDVSLVRHLTLPTGTYTAVLDEDGELYVAVAAMAATDALLPADLAAVPTVPGLQLLVLDANLQATTVVAALQLGARLGIPVVLDPVSVPKAARLRPLLSADLPIHTITPNLAELEALTGRPGLQGVEVLLDQGVERVWVRRGAAGSVLADADGMVQVPALPTTVVDVTGAGDAMLGAYCHALLQGADPVTAARLGHSAAALTVAVSDTVRTDLNEILLRAMLVTPPAEVREP